MEKSSEEKKNDSHQGESKPPPNTEVSSNRPVKKVYIARRPWGEEMLNSGFVKIVNFLLENKEIEYQVYIEESFKSQSDLCPFSEGPQLNYFSSPFTKEDGIDFVITCGGDGTIFWAHKMLEMQILPPLLCFNGGTLCFLSNFCISEAGPLMEFFHGKIVKGEAFEAKKLPRLNTSVEKKDQSEAFQKKVMNDVVIERSTSGIIILDLYINDSFAVSIKSDGLLISSSTGSTGYNLSLANGIILHSDLECIIINPMASMSLSSRPIIVPKGCKLKVVFNEESRNDARVVYDGLHDRKLDKGDALVIDCCPNPAQMIVPDTHNEMESWIHKLRELRGWQ